MALQRFLALLFVAAALAACAPGEEPLPPAPAPEPTLAGEAAFPGREAVPIAYRAENNSDALVRWKLAGVRDRIVVHLDGHIDLDWLPEETLEAIRAAGSEEELRALEAHPHDLEAPAHGRFGIWNYLYPAWRLGIVREMIWVVPDGTLSDPEGFGKLRRDLLALHLQGVSAEEVLAFTLEGGVASGTVLGLPVRVLELAALPALEEPVLLDLDADYFGTADATGQRPTYLPLRSVAAVMERLAELGLRSDLATLCNSNVGGFLPIESRGMADEAWLWLTDPVAARARVAETGTGLRAGRELLLRGEAAAAAERFRSLREGRPDDPAPAFLLSRALDESGDPGSAAEALADAAAADPAYARAELSRADTLYLMGAWAEALALYRELAAGGDPEAAGYLRRRIGNCLYRLGRVRQAEEAFREVVEAHPGHADSWADLAVCLLDLGRMPEGTAALEEAVRRDPHNGEHLRKLAAVYQQQGRGEEALRAASRALALRPGDPLCRLDYGLILGMSGKLEEARPHAQLAAQLDPRNPRPYLLLGELALRSGRPGAAVASFREALRLDPENPAARAALQEAQRQR
jgi:tetratricopeptide (TPR) repeat protein